jgi:hypothetical protein
MLTLILKQNERNKDTSIKIWHTCKGEFSLPKQWQKFVWIGLEVPPELQPSWSFLNFYTKYFVHLFPAKCGVRDEAPSLGAIVNVLLGQGCHTCYGVVIDEYEVVVKWY